MHNLGMQLAWITVSDFNKALEFYTTTLGLKICHQSKEQNWAELEGENGARLGICSESAHSSIKAGCNAVIAFTVSDLEETLKLTKNHDLHLVGDIVIVPNEVKMQLFQDQDGNYGQFVQLLGNCCMKKT